MIYDDEWVNLEIEKRKARFEVSDKAAEKLVKEIWQNCSSVFFGPKLTVKIEKFLADRGMIKVGKVQKRYKVKVRR